MLGEKGNEFDSFDYLRGIMKNKQTVFMKKFTLTIFAMVFMAGVMIAQELLPPVFTYSHKKTSYITLNDGSTLEGVIKDLDRKKGIIEEVKLEMGDGKKRKIKPEEIKHMYLPSSGFEKFANSMSFLSDATKWDNDDLDQALFGQGYTYIESSKVMVKKKQLTLLVQLLNPHFSGKIKVYHDPLAGETASLGVGGIKVAGGLDKSYYVKKEGKPAAVRLKKKNYDEEFKGFYGSCSKVAKMNPKWSDFATHVYTYAKECN